MDILNWQKQLAQTTARLEAANSLVAQAQHYVNSADETLNMIEGETAAVVAEVEAALAADPNSPLALFAAATVAACREKRLALKSKVAGIKAAFVA
jgi:hypothetical protein